MPSMSLPRAAEVAQRVVRPAWRSSRATTRSSRISARNRRMTFAGHLGVGEFWEARAERSQAFAELQLEDEQGLVALDVGCVRRLARLVAMSKAQVVVSSTWGKDPALYEHLLSSLQRLGGDALRNAVVDVTPRGSLGRGFEILQWLEAGSDSDALRPENGGRATRKELSLSLLPLFGGM
ncbi:unnamed protein product [Effrenium voratum]|nr:unnamed protein product [Effrenium voratum]